MRIMKEAVSVEDAVERTVMEGLGNGVVKVR